MESRNAGTSIFLAVASSCSFKTLKHKKVDVMLKKGQIEDRTYKSPIRGHYKNDAGQRPSMSSQNN